MGFYSHDKIYFSWIPRKTKTGWKWLTWIRDVLVSVDGKKYNVFTREHYMYVKWRFFRSA